MALPLSASTVHAEVYICKPNEGIHYVKLIFYQTYFSGFVVRPSTKHPGELMVGVPSYRTGPTWKQYLEFEAGSPIKQLFESKAIGAANNHACDTEVHKIDSH
jgi:hypothetical protein